MAGIEQPGRGSADRGVDGDEADVVGRVEESGEEDRREDERGGALELRPVGLARGGGSGGGGGGEEERWLAAWHSHREGEREVG